jgi:hypothetical protein
MELSMPGGTAFVALAMLALGFAGCGSTPTPGSSLPGPGVTIHKPLPPVQSITWNVELSGVSEGFSGASNGSAFAVVGIKASTLEICWQFSNLKNVTAPTAAYIYRRVSIFSGKGGRRLAVPYSSSGCTHWPEIALRLLGAKPKQFWLSIHTARFPGGAVRGQF